MSPRAALCLLVIAAAAVCTDAIAVSAIRKHRIAHQRVVAAGPTAAQWTAYKAAFGELASSARLFMVDAQGAAIAATNAQFDVLEVARNNMKNAALTGHRDPYNAAVTKAIAASAATAKAVQQLVDADKALTALAAATDANPAALDGAAWSAFSAKADSARTALLDAVNTVAAASADNSVAISAFVKTLDLSGVNPKNNVRANLVAATAAWARVGASAAKVGVANNALIRAEFFGAKK